MATSGGAVLVFFALIAWQQAVSQFSHAASNTPQPLNVSLAITDTFYGANLTIDTSVLTPPFTITVSQSFDSDEVTHLVSLLRGVLTYQGPLANTTALGAMAGDVLSSMLPSFSFNITSSQVLVPLCSNAANPSASQCIQPAVPFQYSVTSASNSQALTDYSVVTTIPAPPYVPDYFALSSELVHGNVTLNVAIGAPPSFEPSDNTLLRYELFEKTLFS